jgi:hypothetical protein
MTVKTITIKGRKFALVPFDVYRKSHTVTHVAEAEEFRLTAPQRKRLIAEARRLGRKIQGQAPPASELAKNEDEDLVLLVKALRVRADPEQSKTVPWERVKREAGLR